jgi:hypothetical protein
VLKRTDEPMAKKMSSLQKENYKKNESGIRDAALP